MENQIQNQNQEVITRTELNYLRATDALKTLNTKLEAENLELKKAIAAREGQIKSQDATISNLQSDINRLRREIETKNDMISDNKYHLAELKTYANRVGELERQINTINRRHESELDLKKYAIKNQEKDIASLKETIEALEAELEEYEISENADSDDEDNEEAEELEDGGTLENEYGDLLNDVPKHEQYQMPEDYVEIKKDAILKLIDGGNISMKEIEALQKVKLNLGGELAVKTEKEQTEKAILDGLQKNGGRIPEKDLISIKGVTLNDGGLVVLAKGGELTLRRNFLHPSFSLIPQK